MCLQALQSFYLRARREGSQNVAGLGPNLHLLETLIRLSEARARADLRQADLLTPSINEGICFVLRPMSVKWQPPGSKTWSGEHHLCQIAFLTCVRVTAGRPLRCRGCNRACHI